jgi:lysophospholipase L1-like esterase
VFLAAAFAALAVAEPRADRFDIRDGDRIVWIGSTVVEREQRYGYWELALHAAYPEKQFTLRNLGWSGDTVFGDARAGFENAAKGFERLRDRTLGLKPTLILVSYGTNESFEGDAGLAPFEKGLEKLLDALKPANARVVLISPPPFEAIPGYLDERQRNARNGMLKKYSNVIRSVAERRGHAFADVFNRFQEIRQPGPFTDNGLHLTEAGYKQLAPFFLNALATPGVNERLRGDAAEPLRQAIIAKNQLYFYRWRPQNETYLFGFRKHEQGNNAKEVDEFDPLTAKADEEIEALRKKLLK